MARAPASKLQLSGQKNSMKAEKLALLKLRLIRQRLNYNQSIRKFLKKDLHLRAAFSKNLTIKSLF